MVHETSVPLVGTVIDAERIAVHQQSLASPELHQRLVREERDSGVGREACPHQEVAVPPQEVTGAAGLCVAE